MFWPVAAIAARLNQFSSLGERFVPGAWATLCCFTQPGEITLLSSPSQLIRSIIQLGIAQGFNWVGGAALAILLPRYLGDVNLGKYTFAFAFTTLIGLGADLGMATYLTKVVARDTTRAASLTLGVLAVRLPLSLAAGTIAIGAAHFSNLDELTRHVVYVLSAAIVVNSASSAVFGALQGLQRMRILAITSVLTKVGYAALAVVLLMGGAGPFELSIGWVFVWLITLGIGLFALFGRTRPSLDGGWATCRAVLLGGLPFFVWQAAMLIYGQIDTVLLSFLASDAVVGWYAAAYRIVMIPVFVPSIIVTVIFPALSAAASHAPTFNGIARRALHASALISIPMALGIMLLSADIIELLGYPETFQHSAIPLALLAPHLPIAAVDVILGTVLNTKDRQRQWALTAVAAAVLNPLLNFVAIPYAQAMFGNGAIGAAAITTFTECFMLVVGLRLLPKGVFDRDTGLDVLRSLGAGAAMCGAVLVTRELPIIVPVVLGAAIYGGTCLAVGAVTITDIKQLRLHVMQRGAAISAG
jgi:O-antigen/teichoic acid export membrane protein